jgi:hypothetical protein
VIVEDDAPLGGEVMFSWEVEFPSASSAFDIFNTICAYFHKKRETRRRIYWS